MNNTAIITITKLKGAKGVIGWTITINDSRYPIDNNASERAICSFTIGRKNWMLSKSQTGAKASANLYCLVETAKVNKFNVYDYLRHIFTEHSQCERR